MSRASYFLWLAQQALGGLLFAWPITIALGAFVAATLVVAARKHRLTFRSFGWAMLPIMVPVALLLWGVIFEQTGSTPTRKLTWQARAVYVLLFAQLPVAAFATWRAVGSRLFASAVAAFVSHYSVWAAFVAIMSVTDDWL